MTPDWLPDEPKGPVPRSTGEPGPSATNDAWAPPAQPETTPPVSEASDAPKQLETAPMTGYGRVVIPEMLQQVMQAKIEADDVGPVHIMPPEIRSGFIRKVYMILTVQLVVTAFIVGLMNVYVDPDWLMRSKGIYYLLVFGSLSICLVISCCCLKLMRKFPTNYILLATYTVAISLMVGAIATTYETYSLMMAAGATACVFGCLTFYACVTKTDFTGMGSYLIAALMAMVGFGFVLLMFSLVSSAPLPETLHLVFAGLACLLFSAFIVYDTQLIVGGRHTKVQFMIDDYAFAALSLYMDVIQLFLNILRCFGSRR